MKGKTYEIQPCVGVDKGMHPQLKSLAEKTLKQEQEERQRQFSTDFYGIIWVSYRKEFTGVTQSKKLPAKYHHKCDAGWGCMIRAGQMLLANCLIPHLFPAGDYSMDLVTSDAESRLKYLMILKQFFDNAIGPSAAYCIANILEYGVEYGRKPGEWYGPSMIVQIFEELNNAYKPFTNLNIVAFPEGVMYEKKVLSKSYSEEKKEWTPTVIFIAYRLGLDKINPEYFPALQRAFKFHGWSGMAGAQGQGALYFVGYQENELIFLDPHVTQPAVRKMENLWEEHLSYHFSNPLKIPLHKLDTCLSLGYYLRSFKDYELFAQEMRKESKEEHTFIQIYEKEPEYDILEPAKEEEITIGEGGKKEVFIVY